MPRPVKSNPDSTRRPPLIGAQLSTAGGWGSVPQRAHVTGAEVVQVFSSNPRMWPKVAPDDDALALLRAALADAQLPLFIHAIYLINPASPDRSLRERSADALTHALVTGALAGADGVVTHLGSHRGEGFEKSALWIAETIAGAWHVAQRDLTARAHEGTPPPVLLETAAGSGDTVGATLAELAILLQLLDAHADRASAPLAGLCLDTAHMFAAGYAVHQSGGLSELIAELEERDLLPRVHLIHLNDSASLLGSRRDRHANPGEGELGYRGIADLVRHPAFANIPFVLEVPGSEGHGPGAAEIKMVKRMRRAVALLPEKPAAP